jgi:hypothetical protein
MAVRDAPRGHEGPRPPIARQHDAASPNLGATYLAIGTSTTALAHLFVISPVDLELVSADMPPADGLGTPPRNSAESDPAPA